MEGLTRYKPITGVLEAYLKEGKVLVLYGPRQAGKTTLLTHYLATTSYRYRLDTGDNIRIRELLSRADLKPLAEYIANYELLVVDEAQKIPHIGETLKLLIDTSPYLRIIVIGSSSFELAGQVGEPLTGRKRTLTLYPVAQCELANTMSRYDLKESLDTYLRFGTYPEVLIQKNEADKQNVLFELAESYLLKDILELDKIKNPKLLLDLLRLLAFQIGKEVSHHELGQQLGIDNKTVTRYLDLLEKAFVIYNLRGFSRNLRKEISKKSRYYFVDTGIRNAIISNLNALELRNDVGELFENFLVIERLKTQIYQQIHANHYFWRTWEQQEIDFIEERAGCLYGYEFKWKPQTVKAPKDWLAAYPNATFDVIHSGNYLDFLLQSQEQ